ncbi:MAG: thymidine phosphorylase family protein [Pseudomonadota bacterium]|nr:thymidine phosphorylase family protein [Pseudomonadota bacterium]
MRKQNTMGAHGLVARRMGIDTHQEPVIYMREDCPVCRAEGFDAQSRIRVGNGEREIIATLNVIYDHLLGYEEAGFSESAWRLLQLREGDRVFVSHPEPVESFRFVRSKLYGNRLEGPALDAIVQDIVADRYSDVQISAFIAGTAGDRLDDEEIIALTEAMTAAGERLHWDYPQVVDKHSVGGLPGNRTTPIVVSIVAACGLIMPKTSSRAITSPSGTADTMETLAPVNLDLADMRRVVDREGACIAWGGAVRLSPADDTLIRVERALDVDSEGQLIASVVSKKAAAGSSHVLIDMPIGPTAKVRSAEAGERLARRLEKVGQRVGLIIRVLASDGSQPVGFGIGPALEAQDVLAVLQNHPQAPRDLRERSLLIAADILEMGGLGDRVHTLQLARQTLTDGLAWQKFQAICEAQGGMRTPPRARHRSTIQAARSGRVLDMDNRRLSRLAKLAGAPGAPAAGAEIHVRLGQQLDAGDPLYTIHAETKGELRYALGYRKTTGEIITLANDEHGDAAAEHVTPL